MHIWWLSRLRPPGLPVATLLDPTSGDDRLVDPLDVFVFSSFFLKLEALAEDSGIESGEEEGGGQFSLCSQCTASIPKVEFLTSVSFREAPLPQTIGETVAKSGGYS